MTDHDPDRQSEGIPSFDPDALRATRRDDLLRRLAELDEAIELLRTDLQTSLHLPQPGRPESLSSAPLGGTEMTSGDMGSHGAAHRLAELFRERDRVAAGLRRHELNPPDPRLCEEAAVAWVNDLQSPQRLLDELVPDPTTPRRPDPLPPAVPPPLKVAAAILRFRNQQPNRSISRLVDLRAVRGVTLTWLRHILHTGCSRLDQSGPPPGAGPRVGVMLPVRLETRFRSGNLLLRVVPDAPWFARHDSRVSQGEVDALARYLDSLSAATTEPERTQAWRELVTHVGGARAVFMLRTCVVVGPDGQPVVRALDPDEIREEPRMPRIEGFPEKLHIWIARSGGPPTLATTLSVDRARLLADFPDPDVQGDKRWWENWDEALDAGLAAELNLDGEPGDIDALFVTGLGDGEPSALFGSHRDEGRMATIPPGTPTNSVDGRAAAPLGDDPDTWWDVLQTPASESDRAVSASLTGDPELLGNLPGPSEPQRAMNSAIVSALWPALWGFAGADVWALPDGTHAASRWAPHALFPEGPFPTLRVGSQPYGLLPATALGDWVAEPKDPPAEAAMRKALIELRAAYATAAEARGTVGGASTEQLLDLIGQVPTSSVYRHRRAWPLELWWLVLVLLAFGVPWVDIDRAWLERHRMADVLSLHPSRRYGTVWAAHRLGIPLVVPEKLPEGTTVGDALRELVRLAFEGPHLFARSDVVEREFLRFVPDSLLLRLAIRSLQVAIGDVGRMLLQQPEPPARPEDVARDANEPSRLEVWIDSTRSDALHAPTDEAGRFRSVADGLLALADIEEARLERLLRATVDTAALRIDPWLVGPPTRRLQDLVDRKSATFHLGAYGWVDEPRPGTPGPTAAGLIQAPSPGQGLTAKVLRDRAVNDPVDNRWDIDFTSRTVRDADRAAEHVRIGAHLAEALGREVERVVADPSAVARLRRDFPVRTEHEGRRTCDGLAVLAAPESSLGLDASTIAGLDRLRAGIDTYGDLLVAEAVHHVTEGRAEVAGAVMDAAAGLSRPPHLGLLRTPREGRAVATSVVLALPAIAAPSLPADDLDRAVMSPTAVADASTAAFVREQVADATLWTFDVSAVDATGAPVGPTTAVTLDDLGLLPTDALALPRTDLDRLAAHEGARVLGSDPTQTMVVGGDGPALYERAARLVGLLGRNPGGLDAVTEQADAGTDQSPVEADLLARFTLVRDTGVALVKQLDAQVAQTAPDWRDRYGGPRHTYPRNRCGPGLGRRARPAARPFMDRPRPGRSGRAADGCHGDPRPGTPADKSRGEPFHGGPGTWRGVTGGCPVSR